ncbi:nicotinamidase-related amidase [Microvirga flocculans]|uniref:Nicotinamidase-related amidase n=1 Tax=Microvirga flocculans TaxID=217168 RepID=A0A7W6IHL0_9HYPH|nr:isochorismatase family protein [Microvirga flocculans]MBB4041637.1 nicotinamidase-related amidase [Microvirga flocculans]
MAVIPLRSYVDSSAVPTLVLVDLQQEYVTPPRGLAMPQAEQALDKCRDALVHARAMGFPVAFVRWMGRAPFFNAAAPFSRWIEGFEPTGGDMVFERDRPSCFASKPFAEVMGSSSSIVMAGFAGEAACLSTMVDAFHRGKQITYLTDASASHSLEELDGTEVHNVIGKLAGIYGEIQTTAEWVVSTSQALLNTGWLNG